jgi:ABC-type molybdenum transport system ATPase subunit/photorepair protein PhrA
MKSLNIELENCYGIKTLKKQLDFSQERTYAIYASNGSMKSSLAQTFQDQADNTTSKDRIFTNRLCSRKITDENGVDLPKNNIFVIRPYYDEEYSHTEKTSTLLVNSKLRKEYEQLHTEIDKSKAKFLEALKGQSGSKKDLEKEISLAFTKSDDELYKALNRIEGELLAQKDTPFADINYDTIFDEKVLNLLGTKDFKTAIEDYIKKYNALLAASTYFKKGMFNYYNASTIAKNLAENGFFDAKHTVNLNADKTLEITSKEQLEKLIEKEKESISSDKTLRTKLSAIEKQLYKNVNVRNFEKYLADHEEILPHLANLERFKEEIWKSYIKMQIELYKDLISKYRDAQKRKEEIEKEASKERTQWERVIEIFNDRFFVPFNLIAKNRISVILGQEPMLSLGFTFKDGTDEMSIEKDELMKVLSTGELRAFYILNIIFEVEARMKNRQETVFVIDDIADSFDYKNKYAIIQYLQDISNEPYFYQIILTHNFDFFRTINSRFIRYSHCLIASRDSKGIAITQAVGIKNIFINDWKLNFFNDPKKKIASIPFIRNIIEYTKGKKDKEYIKLTSLLHWNADTSGITQDELDRIYTSVFGTNGNSDKDKKTVIDIIRHEANECLNAGDGINFENKIVLSIAIRIAAEEFMVNKINSPTFVASIGAHQTPKLQAKFMELFSSDKHAIEIIQRVILMTPDNIHINSFMYEPILDMAEDHLKKLYKDVLALT